MPNIILYDLLFTKLQFIQVVRIKLIVSLFCQNSSA